MYIKDAKNESVSKILTLGTFSIPDFQRGYSWDEDNISEFYEDIFDLTADDTYFLGAIILNYPSPKLDKEFKIIDGQQRITTITTCLCAFRDVIFANEEDLDKDIVSLAETINNSYIYFKDSKNFGKETPILKSENMYPIFQNNIQACRDDKDDEIKAPKEDGEKLLVEAYQYFYKKFSILLLENKVSKKVINQYIQKLLDTQIVYVKVEGNTDDANIVFNVLNSRGKDLYVGDFLKSELFRKYPKGSTYDKNKNVAWKKIEDNISHDRKQFFNYFYASNFGKISDINLSKGYSKLIKKYKENDIKQFLKLIESYSGYYNILTKVKYGGNKKYLSINEYIKILFNLNIEQPRILLMTVMHIHENNPKIINFTDFENILEKILNFHVFFSTVMSLRPSGLDKMYSTTSVELLKIINGTCIKKEIYSKIDALFIKLNKKLKDNTTEEIFLEKLKDKRFSKKNSRNFVNKNLFFYLLLLLEKDKNSKIKITDDMTLEHFYPEGINSNWTVLKEDELKYKIGNIFLLEEYLNGEVKTDKFEDKKDKILKGNPRFYNPTNITSTSDDIKPLTSWSDKDIEYRIEVISKTLFNKFI